MRQVFYYKMPQFYYETCQLLQNAMILLQNVTVITKYDVYYKMHRYNMYIAPVSLKYNLCISVFMELLIFSFTIFLKAIIYLSHYTFLLLSDSILWQKMI